MVSGHDNEAETKITGLFDMRESGFTTRWGIWSTGVFESRNGSKSFWKARSRTIVEIYTVERDDASFERRVFFFVFIDDRLHYHNAQ